MGDNTTAEKRDPAACLHEECVVRIFSFVGGSLAEDTKELLRDAGHAQKAANENDQKVEYVEEMVDSDDDDDAVASSSSVAEKTFLRVQDAGRFYYTLSSVCRGWKHILDKSMKHLVANIEIDFDAIIGNVVVCTLWLCRHKLDIRSIKGRVYNTNSTCQRELPLLMHVLKECDTVRLSDFQVILLSREAGDEASRVLGADPMTQIDYQNMLALHCPNIKNLLIVLCVTGSEHEGDSSEYRQNHNIISPRLFSLPSIQSLHISFQMEQASRPVDKHFFSRLVQNLPSIKYFSLDSPNKNIGEETFHIRSMCLEQILVENFTKHVSFSLDCPNLKVFRCKGGFFGLYNDPETRQLMVQQKVVHAENIPRSCLGLVQHVCNPRGHPIGMPFHHLLGPTVSFLPSRNPHA